MEILIIIYLWIGGGYLLSMAAQEYAPFDFDRGMQFICYATWPFLLIIMTTQKVCNKTALNYWIIFFGSIFCILAVVLAVVWTWPELADPIRDYVDWVMDVAEAKPAHYYRIGE